MQQTVQSQPLLRLLQDQVQTQKQHTLRNQRNGLRCQGSIEGQSTRNRKQIRRNTVGAALEGTVR